MNAYKAPGPELSSFHGLAHLILKNLFDLHTICISPTNILHLVIDTDKIKIQPIRFQGLGFNSYTLLLP